MELYSKLCENTPPCGHQVSTQFLVFPISTRVDITVYRVDITLKYIYAYTSSPVPLIELNWTYICLPSVPMPGKLALYTVALYLWLVQN